MANLELACPKCREHFVIDETAAVAPEGKTVVVRCTACSHSGSVVAFEREVDREEKEAKKKEWALAKEKMRAAKAAEKAERLERAAAAPVSSERVAWNKGWRGWKRATREERMLARSTRRELARQERPFREAESARTIGAFLFLAGLVIFFVGVGACQQVNDAGTYRAYYNREAPHPVTAAVSVARVWVFVVSGCAFMGCGAVVRCLAGIWLAVLGKGSEGQESQV